MADQYEYQKEYQVVEQSIGIYKNYLYEQERHLNTIRKYVHDVRKFLQFVRIHVGTEDADQGEPHSRRHRWPVLKREWVLCYKEYLVGHYKVSSANSMLAALNGYLKFIGREDCCVQLCRVQRQIFREEERELSRDEYQRLVIRAEKDGNLRLGCILQTIGSTGIRVGELPFITVEVLDKRVACISFKGKERCIILPQSLVNLLKKYCRQQRIRKGSIFITRSGRPIDRQNIWAEMKKLCRAAGIPEKKGFPHNLRHLFARTYYEREKDIVRLADYLGHSNVETTRRYTRVSSMQACMRQLELGMLVEGYLDRTADRKEPVRRSKESKGGR